MPSQAELAEHYRGLSDNELQRLSGGDGFTPEARQVLDHELCSRNLTAYTPPSQKAKPPRERLREDVKEKTYLRGRGRTGLYLYGRRYLSAADKAADIQLRTKWFAVSGIPLVPLASFRFRCKQKSWWLFHWTVAETVVGRVPLDWTQVILTWLKTLLSALLIFGVVFVYEWLRHPVR
jgi:hypothetical protein